jgi:threonine dehydrogenase-like Zn-dependent dehydrogenase
LRSGTGLCKVHPVKALVWHGEQELRLEDVREPEPADGEVALDVTLAGICGSDLHGYRGHPGPRVPPLVLGHEVVGRVDGARFTVYPLVGCGECERCGAGADNLCASWRLIGMHRPGVFAERVVVPRRSLVPVPDALSDDLAVLVEPTACCVGALAPHSVGPGRDVVVIGCGPIGLLTAYVAARAGARVTAIDPVRRRRETARRLGAAGTAADAAELAAGSADVVVDAAGFEPTWRAAIEVVRAGGVVVVLGLGDAEGSLPMAVVVRRAVTVRGQFAYTRDEFARAIDTLATGDLELSWLDHMPLADGPLAFAQLVERPERYSKILLEP